MINATDTITLEDATPAQVAATYGDGEKHAVLKIGQDTFTLRTETLPGGIHQAHEIQRRRVQALAQHEPWCDQQRHSEDASCWLEPVPECIGRDHVIKLSGSEYEYGGYWQQREGSREPVLFTEWPGGHLLNLCPREVRQWFEILGFFASSPDVDEVRKMLGDALDELLGDSWRGADL